MRRALEERGASGVSVCSAGICAADGMSASSEAIEVMREYGIDLTRHFSRSALPDPEGALFLCMTRSHLEMLRRALPGARAQLFFEYAGLFGEVSDPYGMGIYAYRLAASKMERAAALAAERILKEIGKGEKNDV